MAENDNQDLVGVSGPAGRILVPRDKVDFYVAKGYTVRNQEKKQQPSKKKVFSKKTEKKEDED